ncbi:hypothetical protein RN04_15775 [Arthrobacter sp. W1]|nr:hypothetical protein RN04_15775 [Arthrobacter sp. W1]
MTTYEIEPDLSTWFTVPREFPGDGFETAQEWADDVAEFAMHDDEDLRRAYRTLALDVANGQFQESDHTFWYAPEDGHAMGTAHLSVMEDDPELELSEIAEPDYESTTPIRVETFQSSVFGDVLQVASTITSDPQSKDGLQYSSAIGHVRTVGRSQGLVFVLDAYDANLSTLAFMMEPMVDLFEKVSFHTDEDGNNS